MGVHCREDRRGTGEGAPSAKCGHWPTRRATEIGHEPVGLCPFHSETTPSIRVSDAKGLFHCFGCGVAGDVLDYLRYAEELDFRAAIESLANGDLPAAAPMAHREPDRGRASRVVPPVAGTTEPMPWSVRYEVVPITIDRGTGRGGRRFPALILACQNFPGRIIAVQRVFLTEAGAKAPTANPKLSLGPTRGCPLRCGPTASRVILFEGPEDGLTLRARFPEASIWVTMGTAGLALAELPREVCEVTLAGDNNTAGHTAIDKATLAYAGQGREVSSIFPDATFNDWNDELMGKRRVGGGKEPASQPAELVSDEIEGQGGHDPREDGGEERQFGDPVAGHGVEQPTRP